MDLAGRKAVERIGTDGAGYYFIHSETIFRDSKYLIRGFSLYPPAGWSEEYYQFLKSFEFL